MLYPLSMTLLDQTRNVIGVTGAQFFLHILSFLTFDDPKSVEIVQVIHQDYKPVITKVHQA